MNEDVITWLRSPEGEYWSRERIVRARLLDGSLSPVFYGGDILGKNLVSVSGFFSVREG